MLYDNKIWISDIDEVTETIPEIDKLAGCSVLITGAAGLVCSAVVDILFRYNDTHKNTIRIMAAGRWIEEMASRFGKQIERDDFIFVPYDASRMDNHLDIKADYIIHGASNASPDMIISQPVETMISNIMGVKLLLDYAKEQKTKRLLYISSSEVYGKKEGNQPYTEKEFGYIDLLNARNSYSIGKRAAETLCASYWIENNVESVIVRPGHIYGPTASPRDTRVSSAWAFDAAKGNSIIMKSGGEQIRSYCYCLDCASAILKILLCGENCQAYNISNKHSIVSIKAMAEIMAKAGNVEVINRTPTKEEKKAFNPMLNSSLDSTFLENLNWHGCFSAERGFGHTVEILKEIYG